MASRGLLLHLLFLIGISGIVRQGSVMAQSSSPPVTPITPGAGRSAFPKGFVFGAASSAYQYEGGAHEGGKGPSIWDTFTHKHPEKIKDHSTGDVAIDSYHRYKEDVKILKDMDMDAYRFSIAWTRILPNGNLSGGINKAGVNYYNNLINELISKGKTPFVTIFHWDTPQGLEDLYQGFLSPLLVKDFVDYADVLFKLFGDRVKHWITFNEPSTYCSNGYGTGTFAPGRCSPGVGNCTAGDSGREPYIACHHLLIAHANAVKLYKEKYQEVQKGKIGITIVTIWFKPYSGSKADKAAAQRVRDFNFGWFMDPLVHGDYNLNMKSIGDRLPKFKPEESKMLKGSYDFIGINYYTTYYASKAPPYNGPPNYFADWQTTVATARRGVAIGPIAASNWLFIYPPGIRDLMLYTKKKYNDPIIYITENGMDDVNNNTLPLKDALNDTMRVHYHQDHLKYLLQSIREGVRVHGYFAWSLMDNFEWADGYTVRFGLNFVDYNDNLKRYNKLSALWFKKFLSS